MKTILATAYAVNPYKGSEDGMGWNFICQIARHHRVVAITRKNNREAIEKFQKEFPDDLHRKIRFHYYDLPYWMRFWKKKERGAMVYFFLWQLFMPFFIMSRKLRFDIAHNLNFHADWAPTFLWLLGKPTVWGPVGHHPQLKKEFIKPIYGAKAYWAAQRKWLLKKASWNFNIFLKISVLLSKKILVMSGKSDNVLNIPEAKRIVMSSVSTEKPTDTSKRPMKGFKLLMVGRMVPLKGFDIAIASFAKFYHQLPQERQAGTKLYLVGKGPYKKVLVQIAKKLKIDHAVLFIDWMERSKLSELYRSVSAFLFPSHEGAGMVVAEALSYGLPVICFDNCGPGAFVTDDCGLRIPYHSYEATTSSFALAIHKLEKQPNVLEKLSEGAFARFAQLYDWNVKGEHLRTIYQDILTPKSIVSNQLVFNQS